MDLTLIDKQIEFIRSQESFLYGDGKAELALKIKNEILRCIKQKRSSDFIPSEVSNLLMRVIGQDAILKESDREIQIEYDMGPFDWAVQIPWIITEMTGIRTDCQNGQTVWIDKSFF